MTTVSELKKEAKNRGLKGYSKMKKNELERLLYKPPVPKPRSKKPIPPIRTTSLVLKRMNNLPPEVQEMIIKRMDQKTKHSF